MPAVWETDWLASRPVFYNELTCRVSHNINDVIDLSNLELDPEGFCNYLDFGYSVFEQTPVKHVKFLRHSSRLEVNQHGTLTVELLDDPAEEWLGRRLSEAEVLDMLRSTVQAWEQSVAGDIVIPTSGGYDSRLLNWAIKDRARICSYTYGISEDQAQSTEVVYAREVSRILGTRWERIALGRFHNYFDDWERLFGVSTHAHGMYHFEFYDEIRRRLGGGRPLLSGIFGDAWAGSVPYRQVRSAGDLRTLGYTHGLHADVSQSLLSTDYERRLSFWERNAERLQDEQHQILHLIRCKMILISYLLTLPDSLGFRPWSPFLLPQLAVPMLTLPSSRRAGRVWQKVFFTQQGLDVESMCLKATTQNTLDLQGLRRVPVKPLDEIVLRQVVKPGYVKWINSALCSSSLHTAFARLLKVRKVGGVLRRMGVKDETLAAYSAYLVLRPIENLLQQRDAGSGAMEGNGDRLCAS